MIGYEKIYGTRCLIFQIMELNRKLKSASKLKKLLIIGDFVVTATLASSWIVFSSDSAASQEALCNPSV